MLLVIFSRCNVLNYLFYNAGMEQNVKWHRSDRFPTERKLSQEVIDISSYDVTASELKHDMTLVQLWIMT